MESSRTLQEELNLLKELEGILQVEKECLIKEDGNNLLNIIEEKKEVMVRLDAIEKMRNEKYPSITLKELEEMGGEWKPFGDEFRNRVKNVQELQETNRILTEQSLAYSKKIISIIQRSGKKPPSTYGSNGVVGNQRTEGFAKINHSV